jgi:hypothetical protein
MPLPLEELEDELDIPLLPELLDELDDEVLVLGVPDDELLPDDDPDEPEEPELELEPPEPLFP